MVFYIQLPLVLKILPNQDSINLYRKPQEQLIITIIIDIYGALVNYIHVIYRSKNVIRSHSCIPIQQLRLEDDAILLYSINVLNLKFLLCIRKTLCAFKCEPEISLFITQQINNSIEQAAV